MAHPFLERLARGPLLADGATGTMLHSRGAALDASVEDLNLTQPDWVREIHLGYIQAGAEIIQTNTFAATRLRLSETGLADRTRDINFRGVKLAREAREISGQPVWIAGSVGPLGRRARRNGLIVPEVAREAYHEQIGVLWEAGADLLVLETFSDLSELSLATKVARETTDLPVVAEMTFGNDGVAGDGTTPADVARMLAALRVDMAGVNCSLGPARVLDFVSEMHAASRGCVCRPCLTPDSPTGRASAWSTPRRRTTSPNTRRPVGRRRDGDRRLLWHDAGPHPGDAGGAGRAVGPEAPTITGAPAQGPLPMVRVSAPGVSEAEDEAPAPTGLLRKLRAGQFVVSVEVDPPRGFSAAKMLEGARIALERGADAVNVADSPMARVRMGALALCVLIQQQVGIETILHFTTRDRSLMGVQADLIGAHALGVRNIIALTGDPPSLGDQPESTPVYDVDSIGLVKLIGQFNDGLDRSGKPFGSRSAFTIVVACDPTRDDLEREVDRFHRKVSGGAHLTMTQPIFDTAVWQRFFSLYEERHGPFPVPVLIGILPLQSHRHASFLHNEVPGITLPASALARMERAGAEGGARACAWRRSCWPS